jgi:hypothetical protein
LDLLFILIDLNENVLETLVVRLETRVEVLKLKSLLLAFLALDIEEIFEHLHLLVVLLLFRYIGITVGILIDGYEFRVVLLRVFQHFIVCSLEDPPSSGLLN